MSPGLRTRYSSNRVRLRLRLQAGTGARCWRWVRTQSSARIYPSTTNEPLKLPAYTKDINTEPKRKTKRLDDPFYIVQAALGGRIHPVSSHANLPDDRAGVIETMWGYLSGADCSWKLVVTVRVFGSEFEDLWLICKPPEGRSQSRQSPRWTGTQGPAGCRPTHT